MPFDRKYIIRREICNFPPQKSKILPQNHRKKFENWKLKIHVKFFGALEFSTDHFLPDLILLWNYLPIIKKREGKLLPPSLLSLANPLEVPQLIGRDVTLSLFPIGPKSPSITGSSELPLKSAVFALEYFADHFFDQ